MNTAFQLEEVSRSSPEKATFVGRQAATRSTVSLFLVLALACPLTAQVPFCSGTGSYTLATPITLQNTGVRLVIVNDATTTYNIASINSITGIGGSAIGTPIPIRNINDAEPLWRVLILDAMGASQPLIPLIPVLEVFSPRWAHLLRRFPVLRF